MEVASRRLKLATKCSPERAGLARAAEAGFHHAELWTDAATLDQWEVAAENCRSVALDYGIHAPNNPELGDDTLVNASRLYRALNCRAMVIHQPVFDRLGSKLLAIDEGLCLAVENHRLSRDEFRHWATSNRYLTLDVEHLWKFTLRDAPLESLTDALDEFLAEFGGKLRHVHLPGYVPNGHEHRPMSTNPPFARAVWERLAKVGYDGLVVSEISVRFQTTAELRKDVELYEAWKSAG